VSAEQPKVKGIAFRTIGLCFAELRGPEARDRALELMSPEVADGYRYHTLLASSWYPIQNYRETLRAFRAVRGDGPELARAIGKLAARHDMSGVHKQILARLISPQALLGMSQRVFNTYYDTGKAELLESRRGFAHCMFRDCVGFDENMWAEVAGSCESLLEIAGAENVRLRVIAGAHDGDASAEFEARWT
jgi:hypothetical protein